MENDKCLLCGTELVGLENEFCESCLLVLKMKYSSTKLLEEKIRCHKRHAKRLKR